MWQLRLITSHTKSTLAMGVPTVLIAAWLREKRNFETLVKLDDIVTPEIRRTRSVPQGDPCAGDLFGAALDTHQPRCSVKWAKTKNGDGYFGLLLFAECCWITAMSPGELQTMARALNELLKSSGLQIDWGSDSKHHCVGNGDHSTNTG